MYLKGDDPYQRVMIVCECSWFSYIIIVKWWDTCALDTMYGYNVIWPSKVTLVQFEYIYFLKKIKKKKKTNKSFCFCFKIFFFGTLSFSFTCLIFFLIWMVLSFYYCICFILNLHENSWFQHLNTISIHRVLSWYHPDTSSLISLLSVCLIHVSIYRSLPRHIHRYFSIDQTPLACISHFFHVLHFFYSFCVHSILISCFIVGL